MGKPKQPRKQEDETSENDFSEQDTIKFRGKESKKSSDKQVTEPPKAGEQPKKKSDLGVRTMYTLLMLFGFFGILAAGHSFTLVFIVWISFMMFEELLRLKRRVDKEKEIPWFSSLNWYFFTIAIYFALGKLVLHKIPTLMFQHEIIQMLVQYHNVIFFMLWAIGFVAFTLSLTPGFYKYQLRIFGWTHIGCFFISGAISFMMQNLYQGLVWFLLPATLVISNDIFAYIFGRAMGKHSLIKLSPKKTWEGFIGGAMCSVLWAFIVSYSATFIPQLICPQSELSFIPFAFPKCEYPSYFNFVAYDTPSFIQAFGIQHFYMSEFNQHAMIMSLFASLIAPFGGFFASGIKRAIGIKDFGDCIPGHGGIIDRFDCQLLMGMFSYVYIHSVILNSSSILGLLTQQIDSLNSNDQLQLFNHLKQQLQNNNLL